MIILELYFVCREDNEVEERNWNKARVITEDTELYSCQTCHQVSIRILKALFMFLLSALTLVCLVASTMALLYIISHLNNYVHFVNGLSDSGGHADCGVPVCKYRNNVPTKACDGVRWKWCLLLVLITPYFFTLLRSMWKIAFKRKRTPKLAALVSVRSL